MNFRIILTVIFTTILLCGVYAQTDEKESSFIVPEGLTASDVIQNYIEAIGGADNLMKITDRTTVMRGKVQGTNVTIVLYQKAPDLLKQDIRAGGMEQTILFNGEKGIMIAADAKTEIPASELEKLKYEATIQFMLKLDELNITTELVGHDVIDGKNAYRIDFTSGTGAKWSNYFDTETGLKLKESKELKTAQGSFLQETFLSDYKEIEGIKYPFGVKQIIGPQVLEFKVSSIKVNSGIADDTFTISEN